MTVAEFINILKGFNQELEVFACSDEDLWQVNPSSMRETTILTVLGGESMEPEEYNSQKDGAIVDKREALLLDLDL